MAATYHGAIAGVVWKRALEIWMEIWSNILKDNTWKRMIKNVLAVEILVILCLIPKTLKAFGAAAFLGALVTIFAHPGRRVGQLVESLIILVLFTLIGLSWAVLGAYLGSLVYERDQSAAYAIRGIFLLFAIVVHGFLRSHTPRVYLGCIFLIVANFVTLLSPSHIVTSSTATQVLYPILTAVGVNALVNLCVFPETSSAYLGQTTISTLNDVAQALRDAERYFVQATEAILKQSLPDAMPNQQSDSKQKVNMGSVNDDACPKSLVRDSNPTISPSPLRDQESSESPSAPRRLQLSDLTPIKSTLRAKLATCRSAQNECMFELAYGCLSPKEIKPISNTAMKKFVAHTIALIGQCESKYSLMATQEQLESKSPDDSEADEQDAADSTHADPSKHQESYQMSRNNSTKLTKEELQLITPRREIESGDVELFCFLVGKVTPSLSALQISIDAGVNVITASIAYAYGVPKLPSGRRAPRGIVLEELDIHVSVMEHALMEFDKSSSSALESAATVHELREHGVDVMPREEVFLLSSFILNLRQAAIHTLDMLKHSRVLVEKRQSCNDRKILHFPQIQWRRWLSTGGGDVERPQDRDVTGRQRRSTLSNHGKSDKDNLRREGSHNSTRRDRSNMSSAEDHEQLESSTLSRLEMAKASERKLETSKSPSTSRKVTATSELREGIADFIEWLQQSEDVLYTFKLTTAVFLVVFPALLPAWNQWYSRNRCIWAAFQLIYVFEVAIGSTVTTFILRAAGTIFGCLWGWGAYEARGGNRVVSAVLIGIGLVPCTYVQLVSKHFKAGQVAMVSLVVVALATELGAVAESGTDNFVRRVLAFLVGSLVALALQVVILPVRARTRMVEALAISINEIGRMESSIAVGINSATQINLGAAIYTRSFDKASKSAHKALQAAETFLPFCLTEPRIKGSFEGLHHIYKEMIFVLHQIVDRLDNMLQVRKAYGSSVLEEFNAQIFAYRRNVVGSINLTLFAVHEALTNKLPLPQFLPSARLAQLRMINRVREVVQSSSYANQNEREGANELARRAVRRKFMSWNANSAAQAEIVEYLEELIELTKLLVGANEFRSGMLTRPTYREYLDQIRQEQAANDALDALESVPSKSPQEPGLTRRRAHTRSDPPERDLPDIFRRMQNRKTNEKLERQRTK